MRAMHPGVAKLLAAVVWGAVLVYVLSTAGELLQRQEHGAHRAGAVAGQGDGMAAYRAACQTFAQRLRPDAVHGQWVQPWEWTAISNADGSVSVGVRYVAQGRTVQVACVTRRTGADEFELQALSAWP